MKEAKFYKEGSKVFNKGSIWESHCGTKVIISSTSRYSNTEFGVWVNYTRDDDDICNDMWNFQVKYIYKGTK